MNRTLKAMTIAATFAFAPSALAETFQVDLNETKALRLRNAANSVVIGNPAIADVAVHDAHLMFVTGKSFGNTNLLVFDINGRQLYSADISVTADMANTLTVTRGNARETYTCTPNCAATPQIGDSTTFFETVTSQAQTAQEAASGLDQ